MPSFSRQNEDIDVATWVCQRLLTWGAHILPSVNWTKIENIRLFLWNVIIFQHFHFHLSSSAIYRSMRTQRPRRERQLISQKFFEKNVICKLRYTEKGPLRPYVRLIEISFIYANDYSCLSSGERICILFTFRTRPSSTCVSKKSNTCVRLSIKCATTNTIHPANRPQFAIYCWHSQCSRLDCYRIQPDLGQNSASIPVSGMERKET